MSITDSTIYRTETTRCSRIFISSCFL